jgi:hypothetical protein
MLYLAALARRGLVMIAAPGAPHPCELDHSTLLSTLLGSPETTIAARNFRTRPLVPTQSSCRFRIRLFGVMTLAEQLGLAPMRRLSNTADGRGSLRSLAHADMSLRRDHC